MLQKIQVEIFVAMTTLTRLRMQYAYEHTSTFHSYSYKKSINAFIFFPLQKQQKQQKQQKYSVFYSIDFPLQFMHINWKQQQDRLSE